MIRTEVECAYLMPNGMCGVTYPREKAECPCCEFDIVDEGLSRLLRHTPKLEEQMSNNRSCEKCTHYIAMEELGRGRCHRFPPVYIGRDLQGSCRREWNYPMVASSDGCGEIEMKGVRIGENT